MKFILINVHDGEKPLFNLYRFYNFWVNLLDIQLSMSH